MLLPMLNSAAKRKTYQIDFKGINYNLSVGESEFAQMRNMTGQHYPVLATRPLRGMVRQLDSPNAIAAADGLCWVDGASLYYGGEAVAQVSDGPKQIARMGALIVVMPDAIYYDTQSGNAASLGCVAQVNDVTVSLARADGEVYGEYTLSDTAPEDPQNGDMWLDTSQTPHALKQYASATLTWAQIETVYLRMAAQGIGVGFAAHDAVSVSGFADESLNADYIISACGPDYIVVIGVIDQTQVCEGPIKVERKAPAMDFICEHNNRLWGCSSAKHEIYACKLGDPTNWYAYEGLSTDSYAATIGSEGAFTAVCAYNGAVLFFKEQTVHRLYGTMPGNFQIYEQKMRGVEAGSEKSIALVNEVLYYKSRDGILAYDGSQPIDVGQALGTRAYHDAVAGELGGRYYLNMVDEDGAPGMYVLNTRTGHWHREDDARAAGFARTEKDLYFLATDGRIWSVGGTLAEYAANEAHVESPLEWMVESGDIGVTSASKKYTSKLTLRAWLDTGAWMQALVSYDGGPWRLAGDIRASGPQNVNLPIIPIRCARMRLRVRGCGAANISGLGKTIEEGSEL